MSQESHRLKTFRADIEWHFVPISLYDLAHHMLFPPDSQSPTFELCKNMKHLILVLVALNLFSSDGIAAEKSKPIKALLVTGGCCHDYERQKLILTKGISARANVIWTVVHQGGTTTDTKIPLYEDPAWAEGFDVVVHNECFAHVKEQAWLDRILEPHKAGTPAVLIHCAMHCYRTGTDDWFEFVGQQSPGHGAHYSYTVDNVNADHPIMQGFGASWVAPKGELYDTAKLWPTCTPLGQAKRQGDNQPQTCIWTNMYRDTRVFGTTIGHYNETMSEPQYLDLVTRGLLWAVNRLDEDSFTKTSEETNEEIRKLVDAKPQGAQGASPPCCGAGNLAMGAPATAKSFQGGNEIRNAVDGNLKTRFCPSGAQIDEWWQVDLGKPEHVKSLRVHWESKNNGYKYIIEASADAETWKTIVDHSKQFNQGMICPHDVDSPNTRYLRLTYLGSTQGGWGSFWEFEAYAGELPELPKQVETSSAAIDDVKAPPEFDVRLFGTPPQVNYPVCLTAAPHGEVLIGVDEQGSLGKEAGRGKVIRCVDIDGDGQADQVNTFATMDHPRGLFYDNGSLWVLHPPMMTVYHDDDRDGVADREERLITGISTEQVAKRGADHTTNGIRMGIDGWIYIAVGDFGFVDATGADGTKLTKRGGGITRIRPDGSNMEVYSWGQRNILDVCIDPYMNIFTRDNTNDGGGWDIRTTHILQSANYGYPSQYINFTDEIMPLLQDHGGGSGCGGFYLHDLRWPEKYNDALYTCDWGRSEVYQHNFPANGATFDPAEETFVKIPRPTDIDVDGSGRMYVSSWKDGMFGYDGPNVGFVAQVTPKDFLPKPFPNLQELDGENLVKELISPSMKHRLHAQREILRRDKTESVVQALKSMTLDESAPLYGRVATIFTMKQWLGIAAHDHLLKLSKNDAVKEFALRALTDRKDELDGLPVNVFVEALTDSNPRVVAQALMSLGRLGDASAAEAMLPLTLQTDGEYHGKHNQANPGRVIPHLAVQALIAMNAEEACLNAISTPYQSGAIWALRSMHSPKVVNGVIAKLKENQPVETKFELLTLLIRLYHQEGEYKGDWWGTRPDTSGPYYDRQPWAQSEQIKTALLDIANNSDPLTAKHLREQFLRHKVTFKELPSDLQPNLASGEPTKPITAPVADPDNPNQIANMNYEEAFARALKAEGEVNAGKKLFLAQNCEVCHTFANGQTPKGPHLVDIGKRYKKDELLNSILKPSAKIAQGFDTYAFSSTEGKIVTGFVVSESAEDLQLRQINGLSTTLKQNEIEERVKREESMMPAGIANNLTPEQLADLVAYLQTLK